ncbi:MAG: hypothetical protein ABIQ44_03275 [Chloroflexia bacterium]
MLVAFLVYCLVALFSVYAFGTYAISDFYAVSTDQLPLLRMVSAALALATLASMIRITRTVILAATNTTPQAGIQVRRAIIRSLLVAAILLATFLLMTLWVYNFSRSQ